MKQLLFLIVIFSFSISCKAQNMPVLQKLDKIPNLGTLIIPEVPPTPFSPTYYLDFSIPFSCSTIINIYRLDQEKKSKEFIVKALDEKLDKGAYRFNWNFLNKANELVGNGLYAYEIVIKGDFENQFIDHRSIHKIAFVDTTLYYPGKEQ